MPRLSAEWDVVVVGGANTDYLVRGPRLPGPGQTVDGELFQEAPGGKGANQAVAACRLGARGGGAPRHIVRGPDAAVDVPTGVALVMVDEHAEKQILTAPGANRRLAV